MHNTSKTQSEQNLNWCPAFLDIDQKRFRDHPREPPDQESSGSGAAHRPKSSNIALFHRRFNRIPEPTSGPSGAPIPPPFDLERIGFGAARWGKSSKTTLFPERQQITRPPPIRSRPASEPHAEGLASKNDTSPSATEPDPGQRGQVGVGPDDLREAEPPVLTDGDQRAYAAAKVPFELSCRIDPIG